MGKTIKEYNITWEGLVFTVCGIYEPEEKESYFEPMRKRGLISLAFI